MSVEWISSVKMGILDMLSDKNYELFAKKARLIVNRADENDKAVGQALVFLYEMILREDERDAREEQNK